MKNKTLYIMIMTMIIVIALAGCGREKEEPADKPAVTVKQQADLTEEEQRLLIAAFGDDENIRAGNLYDYQKEALIQLRTGMEYLKEKYPGEDFSVLSFSNATKLTEYASCYFRAGASSKEYLLTITPENGKYVCRDTYYGEKIRNRYDAELESILRESGYETKLYTDFSTPAGMDVDGSATMRTVNEARPKIARCTFIFVDSNLMGQGENIQNALYDKGAYGSYILYFSDNLMDKSIDQLVLQRKEFKSITFNIFTK